MAFLTTSTARAFRTRLEQIIETEGRKQRWLVDQVNAQLGDGTVNRSSISNIVGGLHADDAIRAAIASALGREIDDVFGEVQS